MIQLSGKPPFTPLQQKLRDKALADIAARREQVIAPLRALFDAKGFAWSHMLDADQEEQVRLAIETMVPWGSRLSLAADGLNPEERPLHLTLAALGARHGLRGEVSLWFEEYLATSSTHVDFRDCSYGIFRARLHTACAMAGQIIVSGSVLARSRIGLVSTPPATMLWIDGDRAMACRTSPKG